MKSGITDKRKKKEGLKSLYESNVKPNIGIRARLNEACVNEVGEGYLTQAIRYFDEQKDMPAYH